MTRFHNVIRVYATTQVPDYDCPWQTEAPERSTGSGVIIGKNQILTGAHVVANATFIEVQKVASPDRVAARVKAICHDMDLALLEIDDKSFTQKIVPAKLGTLPKLRDNVLVAGFPIGGEEISVTEGVVSRVEVQSYDHSQRRLLAVTVDAAINSGNSGGPVFKGDKIAGVAFQKLGGEAENIGEMVPPNLIRHFLKQAKNNASVDVPGFGLWGQTLQNETLRKSLGMKKSQTGVLISAVEHGGSADGVLKPRDILMRIGEVPVSNNATVLFRGRHRTHFSVLLGELKMGQTLPVTFLRNGKVKRDTMTLRGAVDLVPRARYDTRPSFFIFGGLVMQPLTQDFLTTWEDWTERAPTSFVHAFKSGLRTPSRRQIVVLSRVLADATTAGYQELECDAVIKIAGKPVRDLRSAYRALQRAQGVVELETASKAVLAVDTEKARQAHARILTRYRIPSDHSDDL